MPDEIIARTDESTRALMVACVNVTRADAMKQDSIKEAVDYAILGTLAAVEQALEVAEVKVPLLVDFGKELVASWVEEVNS